MYTDATPPIADVEEVLDGVTGVREQLRLLDRGLVVLAVEWAKLNPGDPFPADHPGFEGMEEQWVFDQLAAKGCLSFDDAAVPEFAICAGMTEYSARKLIRESLMLVHLLPRVWARVLAGGLEVWRARNLAGDCFDLSIEAIEFVDRHMSRRTARITATSRKRILAEARKRFEPAEEAEAEEEMRQQRGVEIFSYSDERGMVRVHGLLDLPDALALDAALTAGAQALKDAGSDAPLGTRRAWALGDLARAATGAGTLFDPAHGSDASGVPPGAWVPAGPAGADPPSAARPYWNGKGAGPPGVKLFIHLHSASLLDDPPDAGPPGGAPPPFGLVEGPGLAGEVVVEPQAVREWFTRPTLAGAFLPTISARPVLDLGAFLESESYTPTARHQDQAHLNQSWCVFPFCTRPAHRCDLDHISPWAPGGAGGATCTCNLANLCRSHHRLKTHGDNADARDGAHSRWSYVDLGEGSYFWSGPRGMEFVSTPTGTYNAAPGRSDAPAHPAALHRPAAAVDLADDADRDATETLIDMLLSKAAMTRGVHNRDYSPMWTVAATTPATEEPEWYPRDDEAGGEITFYLPLAPPPERGGRRNPSAAAGEVGHPPGGPAQSGPVDLLGAPLALTVAVDDGFL